MFFIRRWRSKDSSGIAESTGDLGSIWGSAVGHGGMYERGFKSKVDWVDQRKARQHILVCASIRCPLSSLPQALRRGTKDVLDEQN